MRDLFCFYKNLPVLITGGAGFIGSHLAQKLVEIGACVTIIDDLSTGNFNNLSSIANSIVFIHDSITNFNACAEATKNKKIIFHLAAVTSVPASLENPYLYHKVNSEATCYLLEACRINSVKNFIFSSSSSVYGHHQKKCSESAFCSPNSPYGYSKLMAEFYCKEYAKLFNINTVILRYFNVFGERQNSNGPYACVVAKFREQLKNNQPITIFGDGTQTRDFIHVSEIVQANLKIGICADMLKGEIFNIATGKSIMLLTLLDNLRKEFPNWNQEVIFAPERAGDIKHSQADCSKYNQFNQEILANVNGKKLIYYSPSIF